MYNSKCHDANIISLEEVTSCMLTNGIILAIGVHTSRHLLEALRV